MQSGFKDLVRISEGYFTLSLWEPWQVAEEPQVTVGVIMTTSGVSAVQIRREPNKYFTVPAPC